MNSVLPSVRSLTEMFVGKTQEFVSEIENVHMVWLEEIQQEANRMFSRDFNAEPELMPKTPSQKKNSRRRRVSAGHQEEGQARRFSKGKRSNLRGSSVKSLNLILEEEAISEVSTSKASNPPKPKRATRKNKQTQPEDADESLSSSDGSKQEEVQNKKPELVKEEAEVQKVNNTEIKSDDASGVSQSPPKSLLPELVVKISAEDRLSAELASKPEASPGRTATKMAIAAADRRSKRSSARCTLKLRHSLAGLRHSKTQESVRRASRRSMLKRKSTRMGTSTSSSSSSNTGGANSSMDTAEEDNEEVKTEAETEDAVDDLPESEVSEPGRSRGVPVPAVERVTRSVAANSPKLAPPPLFSSLVKMSTPAKKSVTAARKQSQATRSSRLSSKRKAPDTEESPSKRCSPPKKSQSTIKPYMRSFLHTVNKNQMLMMTPGSTGRNAVIKSFIKQTTPLKDPKINMGIVTKERYKLEALRRKQEQEEERMRKMEEEKKKKQEELKRKREERIKRVFEAKVKEELREEEKKKKIEQKMAQIDEKNDKRQAEEKAKKKLAAKRQEELEQKKKLEEEARKKKIQQEEEEKRQQELAAKRKAEEEEQQARKARERQREQELELERERQAAAAAAAAAAAERERLEKEKALALQREVERAAREKEKRELEERRKALEDKRKLEEQQRLAAKEKALKEREEAKQREAAAEAQCSVMKTPIGKAGLNVTVDMPEMSPQSYTITPKGGDKKLIISKNPQNYGMDQNSDDSTDDESAPRKPIPAWAGGANLEQLIMKQYFNPIDVDSIFQPIEPPRLEDIFYKSKPRYFKRTSSAVWHSPPAGRK
ncbi:inner centromere protein A isoform X1 [Poecilia reticulata]|uniref:inner centromere protein A isoform X1 n=1 Tax=Poecilia reticulata TaxID=8081 RepID=UPI0004A3E5B0|nr:PREDICTED: inner centromere protein isoform X1 [Poecilia reticulata]